MYIYCVIHFAFPKVIPNLPIKLFDHGCTPGTNGLSLVSRTYS